MSLPPGPRLPAIAQTAMWMVRSLDFLSDCRARHGDLFTLRLTGFPPAVFACSPAAIKTIFSADPETVRAGAARRPYFSPVLGTRSLLVLDGARHLRRRRLMLPAFHGDRMKAYAGSMAAATAREIDGWPRGEPFALLPRFQRITQEVILETVFGIDDPRRLERFRETLVRFIRIGASPLVMLPPLQRDLGPLSPWGRVVRASREVDRLIHDEIRRRRQSPERGDDVLAMLLDARDDEGRPLTDAELRDELVTQLVAGHDTTAASLAWFFVHLLGNPAARRELLDEIDAVVGDGPVTAESVGRLSYLDAAVRESLRLMPILSNVGRWLREPLELEGRRLPANVSVSACIYLAHRDPEVWPDPGRFDPDRFLGKRPDPYAWLPFGGGVRRCIGMAFALYEMKVVIASILSRVRLELAPAYRRVARLRSITYQPADGCTVTCWSRPSDQTNARRTAKLASPK